MNYTQQILKRERVKNIKIVMSYISDAFVALSIFVFAFIFFSIIN